ncbi:GMC oxidoreductase [Azospirillum sp. ST 5-10]|uniref:GMC oxidoreductase n=1 Tax=unclassified Azospirillum TaxID=2630922 RepID=UPI003F4A7783
MFIDARKMPSGKDHQYDVCIVGAGAAGLTIALEMRDRPWRVALLEAGGLDADGPTQALYAGDNVGRPYEPLATARSRYFGGSTNCWGGSCRPMEDSDFLARPWVPNSGWPITRDEMRPFVERARDVLGLGPFDDVATWAARLRAGGTGFLPVEEEGLENRVALFAGAKRLGDVHRESIRSAANVTCLLNANVTAFEANADASLVERVRVATLGGNAFSVSAKVFVLCCGGIENARLLLLSNAVEAAGLGNRHGLVGRYFADHPRVRSSVVRLADQRRHRSAYDETLCLARHRLHLPRPPIHAALSPAPALQERERLLNSRTYLVAQYHGEASAAVKAIRDLRVRLRQRHKFGTPVDSAAAVLRDTLPQILPHLHEVAYALFDNVVNPAWVERRFALETVLEPVPNPESRVTLGTARDALGLNVARLDWRLTAQDRDNFLRTHRIVDGALVRLGLVRSSALPDDPGALWDGHLSWCWHHMGTTRMHRDPRHGVVDAQCRVHGVGNLFVGGSSVFPTMGSDHPTINIVALALRLADQVSALFGRDAGAAAGLVADAA